MSPACKTHLKVDEFQVIRLADCIRVSELELDGCPRDTGPFLIETTEKIYVFAVHRQQLDDWTHKLCEVAFPVGKHTLKHHQNSAHSGGITFKFWGFKDFRLNNICLSSESDHIIQVRFRM